MTTAPAYAAIAAFLKARSGIALGPDKLYLLETRLNPLLASHGLADLAALAEALGRPGMAALGAAVVEALTTNETSFFRDTKPFAHLTDSALPALLAGRAANAGLRIWSAACSSGQEPYSLAMLLAEQAVLLRGRPVEILATDLDEQILARAREGVYSQFEVQRGLPVRRLVAHFGKEGGNWRVAEALRAQVRFRCWNLLQDPQPLGRFDIVFCRNVLIYFDIPTKARVLEGIARVLTPDGVLYLGAAETVLGITSALAPVPDHHGAYRRAPA